MASRYYKKRPPGNRLKGSGPRGKVLITDFDLAEFGMAYIKYLQQKCTKCDVAYACGVSQPVMDRFWEDLIKRLEEAMEAGVIKWYIK